MKVISDLLCLIIVALAIIVGIAGTVNKLGGPPVAATVIPHPGVDMRINSYVDSNNGNINAIAKLFDVHPDAVSEHLGPEMGGCVDPHKYFTEIVDPDGGISRADWAVQEMKEYGIPASISLAQGLLESGANRSTLSRKYKNHFGIKGSFRGKSVKLRTGEQTKDGKKYFIYARFRHYPSEWWGWRDHSLLLTNKRYGHLTQLCSTDYINWAKGIKEAGYATSLTYTKKLILIIEKYELYRFDEPGYGGRTKPHPDLKKG